MADDGDAPRRAVEVARDAGVDLADGAEPIQLEPVRHRFTHLDATYRPVILRGEGPSGRIQRWLSHEDLWEIALPVAQRKIAAATEAALRE